MGPGSKLGARVDATRLGWYGLYDTLHLRVLCSNLIICMALLYWWRTWHCIDGGLDNHQTISTQLSDQLIPILIMSLTVCCSQQTHESHVAAENPFFSFVPKWMAPCTFLAAFLVTREMKNFHTIIKCLKHRRNLTWESRFLRDDAGVFA